MRVSLKHNLFDIFPMNVMYMDRGMNNNLFVRNIYHTFTT